MFWKRLGILLGVVGCGCVPSEQDDGVARCDNVDECAAPDNSRWDVECVHGEDQDPSTPKVCAPTFRIVSCDPAEYAAAHPLRAKYDEATNVSGVYVGCDVDGQGTLGCAPTAEGTCESGLEKNAFGVCDDPTATYPAVPASPDRAGLDVLDQFCRNYFCDAEWMCDASTGTAVCRPCDPNGDELGQGACGELYTKTADGAGRSTVYEVDIACGENGLSTDPSEAERLAGEKLGQVPASG